MTARRPLVPGVYDAPVTAALQGSLSSLPPELHETEPLDPSDSPRALARLIHGRLVHALAAFSSSRDDALARQLELTNRVLAVLENVPGSGATADDHVVPPGARLLAVRDPAATALGRPASPARPEIPLATSDLLVNGRHDVSLGPEVKRELASADRVDLLCSFLKWSGYRLVEDALRAHLQRRPGSVRVLTTAYMSATDRRALDELVALGAQLKVSYDTTRTRLHAKAWLFHRDSGFSTACIGSSNLSAAAMLDGLEWNVRLSQVDNGPILDKFRATFEQYWDDPEFAPYDPKEFDDAIRAQKREGARRFYVVDVEPRPHQREILDDLASERARGHHRNLVVAATGTGKTIVAALDYLRLRREGSGDSRLLFVAHRREILEQSLDAFRAVLRDGAFGELLVGDERPVRGEHVFASIQSLSAERIAQLAPDAFDVVIVDEFHHAAADTYQRLLDHVRPRVLLGLTATPERADGKSVLGHFDGRIASELRLWKALDQELLSPFHYFGIGGAPDLRGVRWSGGRYDASQLSNVYTADDVFARRVIQEVHKRVRDAAAMSALGFCVDVAHAEFMARRFTEAGLLARAVSAGTSRAQREETLGMLRAGTLRAIFSVDIFNEGVDLPDVDTVLFLRPTESATVFLQQLGRGLRKTSRKDCLTVLDFIGGAHRRFRFDLRYRAIVGGTRRSVKSEIERGFPSLPSGCVIQLDRVSQQAVLENVDHALGLGKRALVEDVRELGDVDLATFLRETGADLEDIYAGGTPAWTFTRMRREAGLEKPEPESPEDQQVSRALSRMLHIDDTERLDGLLRLVSRADPPAADAAHPMQRWLFVLLGWVRHSYADMPRAWSHLWSRPALRRELAQLLAVLADRSRWLGARLGGALRDLPLLTHATYTLDEILAGIDERSDKGGVKRIQTGVFHVPRRSTDLLFITLEKSEKHYTPTTLYDDYPISPTRFHWESQSIAHEDAPTGRRYISAKPGAKNNVLLFVRQRSTGDRGETMPYVHLGRGFYRSHRGARPMQIEWDLEVPMPAWLYQETKRAAG